MKQPKTYRHIDGVKVAAKFSKDGNFRYRLDVSLKNPAHKTKTVCVVMQNPSRAGEEVADKSVKFMEKVVFLKNLPEFADARRLIVVNQFARIQTNNFQGLEQDIGEDNNFEIESVLKESDVIIIGWGSTNGFDERKSFIFDLLGGLEGKQFFQTRMHPARGCFDDFIQPFNQPLADNVRQRYFAPVIETLEIERMTFAERVQAMELLWRSMSKVSITGAKYRCLTLSASG